MGLYSTVAPPRPSLIHDFQAVARETRELRHRTPNRNTSRRCGLGLPIVAGLDLSSSRRATHLSASQRVEGFENIQSLSRVAEYRDRDGVFGHFAATQRHSMIPSTRSAFCVSGHGEDLPRDLATGS